MALPLWRVRVGSLLELGKPNKALRCQLTRQPGLGALSVSRRQGSARVKMELCKECCHSVIGEGSENVCFSSVMGFFKYLIVDLVGWVSSSTRCASIPYLRPRTSRWLECSKTLSDKKFICFQPYRYYEHLHLHNDFSSP